MSSVVPPRTARVTPGPPARWLVGALPELQRLGQVAAYEQWWRQYGDSYRVRLGPIWMYVVTRPEQVRHVLVTNAANYRKGLPYARLRQAVGNGLLVSAGDTWRASRQALQPLFRADAVPRYADLIIALTRETIADWQQRGSQGQAIDVKFEMMRLTMRIISRAILSLDVAQDVAQLGEAFDLVVDYVAQRTVNALSAPQWLPTPTNRRFHRAIRTIQTCMRRLLATRATPNGTAHDVLDSLLQARQENPRDFSEQQLLAELTNLFFAGYETTSLALFWTHWLLADNPQVQARLQGATSEAIQGREWTADIVPGLGYARAVVQESLRLYPPVWAIARQANTADQIGEDAIPKNALVLTSQYLTQRHPQYWPDPLEFQPERFLTGGARIVPGAYFPFGLGQRMCLGDMFALQEATLVVALIATQCHWERVGHEPVVPWSCGTLHPKGTFHMLVRPR